MFASRVFLSACLAAASCILHGCGGDGPAPAPSPPAPLATETVKVPEVGEVLCNVLSDNTLEGLGIPFAAAPVGQNRFRPPQPVHYASSHVDATAYGPACSQVSPSHYNYSMSEDCLTLNIWSPASRGHELLPVFFWIHGGAFVEGSGRVYNGSRLANLGLVAVSINYRLGGFGWFASEEIAKENPDAPGNGAVHGLLDQVAALRWVRAHIAAFGGNKDEITIAGESAGSMSTCIHLHLPMSKDLFKRAIMESGSCVADSPWGAFNATLQQIASKELTLSVNATDLASLRHVPTDTMLHSPFFNVNPAADGWYMKQNPSELPVLPKGVEILVGANSMDSVIAPPYTGISSPDFAPKNTSAFKSLATDYFGASVFEVYPEPASSASEDDVAKAFYRMSADVCNTCPKHFAAQKFLAAHLKVFSYEFAFARAPWQGLSCHGCEMFDVFNQSVGEIYPDAMRASYDPNLGDAMSRYWASFVKSGLKSDQPHGYPAWPEYSGPIGAAKSLEITTGSNGEPQISIHRGIDSDRCTFFENFLKAGKENKNKYTNFCWVPVPLSIVPADTAIIV